MSVYVINFWLCLLAAPELVVVLSADLIGVAVPSTIDDTVFAVTTEADVREESVVCFAHVTNQMGQAEEDFEKGKDGGSQDALEVIDAATTAWQSIG